jgi:hypothetical protein
MWNAVLVEKSFKGGILVLKVEFRRAGDEQSTFVEIYTLNNYPQEGVEKWLETETSKKIDSLDALTADADKLEGQIEIVKVNPKEDRKEQEFVQPELVAQPQIAPQSFDAPEVAVPQVEDAPQVVDTAEQPV